MTIMTIKKTEGPYDYCRSLRLAFWFDANETQSFELLANRYGQNILLLQLEILIFVFSIIHQEEFMLPWLKVLPWQCAPLSFVKLILKKINKATIYSNIAPLRCSNSSVNEYRLWLFSLLENSLVSGWQLTFETIWDRRPNE